MNEDATQEEWWNEQFRLPLLVEAREGGQSGSVQWATRTDGVRSLEAPVNRPRCELQALVRTLNAVLRLGGTGDRQWRKVVLDVVQSHYLAVNATRPRLQKWYKNAYKGISNRPWPGLAGSAARPRCTPHGVCSAAPR